MNEAATSIRDRKGAHECLVRDYFAQNCVYTDEQFRRRFRMSRRLFLRISNDLANYDYFFTARYDARGRRVFTTFQKNALRQLAYDTSSDSWDEYLNLSKRISWECLYEFTKGIVNMYSEVYLCRPMKKDIEKLYAFHEERHGFHRMLGIIDCTHWQWRNFPSVWRGQYMCGDIDYPTIILEAVCSQDFWIWHAFFGAVGSNNDSNVLAISHIFDNIIRGMGPDSSFMLNGVSYKHGYYLGDGIYPFYMAIIKTIPESGDEKGK